MSKKKVKLWRKKARTSEPDIPLTEIYAMQKAYKKKTPWTPWQKKGGGKDG
jgi:hypothetical protein